MLSHSSSQVNRMAISAAGGELNIKRIKQNCENYFKILHIIFCKNLCNNTKNLITHIQYASKAQQYDHTVHIDLQARIISIIVQFVAVSVTLGQLRHNPIMTISIFVIVRQR